MYGRNGLWFNHSFFSGLKFLVRLFNDQGLVNEGKEYANKLNKLEKNLAQKEQVSSSAV